MCKDRSVDKKVKGVCVCVCVCVCVRARARHAGVYASARACWLLTNGQRRQTAEFEVSLGGQKQTTTE